ncbi:MAG: tetratricopeptide repeat protein [Candidatus Thorarchaeota archaeon]|nr:tetratricopeptide repeat protein [Candidatus Thorarchaeota archaeon]
MALFIPLLIAGIVTLCLIMMIPSLVTHTIGQLLIARPNDFEGWCYYGTLLERRGHYLQAYNAYQKSMAVNPHYEEAWKRLDKLIRKMETDTTIADSFSSLDSDVV